MVTMNTAVISYSMTGNNNTLATNIAKELKAEHIRVTESKKRSYFKIGVDMLLNRTPKVFVDVSGVDENDHVILVAPVWMGQIASPLRKPIKDLKGKIDRYAFVSISGGADGPNPKLAKELKKRLGKGPEAVIDMHIADLLPSDPKPTRQDTSDYRLNEQDAVKLTEKILIELEGQINRV